MKKLFITSLSAIFSILFVTAAGVHAEEETANIPQETEAYGWHTDTEGNITCTDENGQLMTGVCEVEGQKYLFSQNGTLKTGWRTIDGKRLYFDETTGKPVSGELKYGGRSYLVTEDEGKFSGLYTDENGERTLYSDDGAAYEEQFVSTDEGLYYADGSGKIVSGEFTAGNFTYVADENGIVQTGVQNIGGELYSCEADGTPTDGIREYDGNSYYFAGGMMESGMKNVDGDTYLFSDTDGTMQYSWQKRHGNTYYFGDDGKMRKGISEADGIKQRFSENGVLTPVKICLDAGHFAKYNQSPVNYTYWESDFTWKFHLMLKDELEKRGIQVITTREDKDIDLDLKERGYTAEGCDLFISIHSNASSYYGIDSPDAYCAVSGVCDDIGLQLAQCIARTMGTYQAGRVCHKVGKYGDWYSVLYGSACVGTPAILLEHSYHTNLRATNWLLNDDNLRRMAAAEAEVLYNYYLNV